MVWWDVTPCSLTDGCHCFGDHVASVLRVRWRQQVSENQYIFTKVYGIISHKTVLMVQIRQVTEMLVQLSIFLVLFNNKSY